MKILIARFSALGDVAIAVHVISALTQQYPNVEIILITKKPFRQLFEKINNLTIFDINLKNQHKRITGLKRAVNEIIEKHNINFYADIHNVIRTNIIKYFLPKNIKKAKIDKGKKEKRKLTKKHNKKLKQLKHSAQRYADVFEKLGFKINLKNYTLPKIIQPNLKILHNTKKIIAIAPFAKHKTKLYPLNKTEQIIKKLSQKNKIIILGGGKYEKKIALKWQQKYHNVTSIINQYKMTKEIAIINQCNAIITMDSGNMHLASLTKTPIICIWGATHQFLGFEAFNKKNVINIQKKLPCRPCSVFGNKKCYKKNNECMNIDAEIIINATNKIIETESEKIK